MTHGYAVLGSRTPHGAELMVRGVFGGFRSMVGDPAAQASLSTIAAASFHRHQRPLSHLLEAAPLPPSPEREGDPGYGTRRQMKSGRPRP